MIKLIIYSPLVKGGADPGSRRLSFRIIVGVWLLIAMVLVNSYASTVISHLTVPKMNPRINTLEDLASANQDIDIITWEETVFGKFVLVWANGSLPNM